jgi:small subunit ribosomal protein S21
VVGEREGLHAEPGGAVHQAINPAGAIEQAVVGVDMEVDEVPVVVTAHARSEGRRGGFSTGKILFDRPHPLGRSHCLFPTKTRLSHMPIEIKIRKGEPVDRALRRMKKKLDRENIIKGVRAKRYCEKPCERRRRKEKVMAFTAMLRRRYAE